MRTWCKLMGSLEKGCEWMTIFSFAKNFFKFGNQANFDDLHNAAYLL